MSTVTAEVTDEDESVTAVNPREVAMLAMYPRERLFIVDLADGSQRQLPRDDWDELLRAIERDPDGRLSPVTAGRYDVVYRVTWVAREEVERGQD